MVPARRRPLLLIVDPSLADAETEGAEAVAAAWPGSTRLLLPALRPGDGPGPGTGYDADAVVVMGSRASVHDRLPWLADLEAWTAPICRGDVALPLLGICFGHQLIAGLSGGRVGDLREDGGKVVRYATTHVAGSRLLGRDGPCPVIASHREVVHGAPPGFRVTATRVDAPVDALEHRELPVFGVQFHPEAREEFVGRAGLDASGLTASLRARNDALLAAFAARALAPPPR